MPAVVAYALWVHPADEDGRKDSAWRSLDLVSRASTPSAFILAAPSAEWGSPATS
jgi:hypothetical protein